jgi:hypothetical protein
VLHSLQGDLLVVQDALCWLLLLGCHQLLHYLHSSSSSSNSSSREG